MGLDFPYNQPSTRVTSRNAEQPKDLKKLGNDGNKEVKKGVLRSCLWPAILLKKWYLAQMVSCEFCKISKNTSFTEHLQTTASVPYFCQLFCRRL